MVKVFIEVGGTNIEGIGDDRKDRVYRDERRTSHAAKSSRIQKDTGRDKFPSTLVLYPRFGRSTIPSIILSSTKYRYIRNMSPTHFLV
jgi:hypothetical protein